jgi:threonyl-tRNA synthetase
MLITWMFCHAVVGEDELNNRSVNARSRDETVKGRSETMPLDVAVQKLLALKANKGPVSKLE